MMKQTKQGQRTHPTEEFKSLLAAAQSTRLFMLQETGPTKFVIEDADKGKFRVEIGHTIQCSCGGGVTEHCIHTVREHL